MLAVLCLVRHGKREDILRAPRTFETGRMGESVSSSLSLWALTLSRIHLVEVTSFYGDLSRNQDVVNMDPGGVFPSP